MEYSHIRANIWNVLGIFYKILSIPQNILMIVNSVIPLLDFIHEFICILLHALIFCKPIFLSSVFEKITISTSFKPLEAIK